MYKWFAIKRIIRGIVIYALLIFIFSLLFNQINETTTRSQLLEQVHMEAQGLRNMKQEQMLAWRENRLKELYSIYHLDKPFMERVWFNASRILTFQFGKSTKIKSSKGSQDVLG